jgi:hypothetical protein
LSAWNDNKQHSEFFDALTCCYCRLIASMLVAVLLSRKICSPEKWLMHVAPWLAGQP